MTPRGTSRGSSVGRVLGRKLSGGRTSVLTATAIAGARNTSQLEESRWCTPHLQKLPELASP